MLSETDNKVPFEGRWHFRINETSLQNQEFSPPRLEGITNTLHNKIEHETTVTVVIIEYIFYIMRANRRKDDLQIETCEVNHK